MATTYINALTSNTPAQQQLVHGVETILSSSSEEGGGDGGANTSGDGEFVVALSTDESAPKDLRYAFLPLADGGCYLTVVRVLYLIKRSEDTEEAYAYEVEVQYAARLPVTFIHVPDVFISTIVTFIGQVPGSTDTWVQGLRLPHHLIYYINDKPLDYATKFPEGHALRVCDNIIGGYVVTTAHLPDDVVVRRVHEVIDYCVSDGGHLDYVVDEVYTYSTDGPSVDVPDPCMLPDDMYVDAESRTKFIRDTNLLNGYHVLQNMPSLRALTHSPAPFETLSEFHDLFRASLEGMVDAWDFQRVKVERIFTTFGDKKCFFYGFADPESKYKENAKNKLSCQGKNHEYYFDSNVRCRIATNLDASFLDIENNTFSPREVGNWADKWSSDAGEAKQDDIAPFPDHAEWERPHPHAILFGTIDKACVKKHGKFPLRFFAEKEDFADGFGAFLSYVQSRGEHDFFKKSTHQDVFNMCKRRTYKWNQKTGYYEWSKKRHEMTVWASLIRGYIALSHGINDPVIIHYMHKYMPIAYAHYKTHFCNK